MPGDCNAINAADTAPKITYFKKIQTVAVSNIFPRAKKPATLFLKCNGAFGLAL